MIKKWLCTIMLCTFILAGLTTNTAVARLVEGRFSPVSDVRAVSTDSRIKIHEVKKGDTLWSIANTFKVDLNTIMLINGLNHNSVLAIGQKIEIPYQRSRVHTIARGETMWDIANKYQVGVQELIQVNSNKNPNLLRIGDKLIIPESTYRLASANPTTQPSRGVSVTSGSMAWPIIGTITSRYGWRQSGFHHGLDIAGNVGDSIRAAASGTVSFVGYKPVYGRMVLLDHPDGRQTLYAHASNTVVNNGQKVNKGDVIAHVGLTGRTTGPHLHFEVKIGEKTFDPLNYLRH